MKLGLLTSSRADYGIYKPLIKKLKRQDNFDLSVIVFGTHLSPSHGLTKNQILADGYSIDYEIETVVAGDSPSAISTSMGLTTLKFSEFWKNNCEKFDLVFCLGDRYEMFSAVAAGVPFNIKFAHLHGGETTLGAIDNSFRHYITLVSSYHFCAAEPFKRRIIEITGNEDNIKVVGALSLDNLKDFALLSVNQFSEKFGIDLSKPTVLCTFHPETVDLGKNIDYAKEIIEVFKKIMAKYQIVITLPNADTEGVGIRNLFLEFEKISKGRIICVENLGSLGYFSCMNHCSFLLGNTSSGIIEAASLNRYVINIGDRQKGRLHGNNVIDAPITSEKILEIIERIEDASYYGDFSNPYYQGGAVNKILKFLQRINN